MATKRQTQGTAKLDLVAALAGAAAAADTKVQMDFAYTVALAALTGTSPCGGCGKCQGCEVLAAARRDAAEFKAKCEDLAADIGRAKRRSTADVIRMAGGLPGSRALSQQRNG
jgi:hypothetical protein